MHPFAKYIQILGKGKNGMQSLTREQAYEAMQMITFYDVTPEQIGAFLMLMRVKEETAEEVAGFTQALRESLPSYGSDFKPAIDWAAYAGKKRQLPWFVLAALVLAGRGYPVLMHGMNRSDERVYVPLALDALDMDTANSLKDAREQIEKTGFSYLPISKLSPLTTELLTTREIFGLRPPLHTVARMLNPFAAPLSVMGVFHPNFAEIHQQASVLLEQPNALVCKGEGGEFERIPDRSVNLYGVNKGECWEDTWDNIIKTGSEVKPGRLNLNHFRAVWDGDEEDAYGEAAVVGTLAMVIKALGLESEASATHRMAQEWWWKRHHVDLDREAG
ncbi:MAG: glycosyl transferase family protein [Sedimenticola sp.]